jgi:hypothetical protein
MRWKYVTSDNIDMYLRNFYIQDLKMMFTLVDT